MAWALILTALSFLVTLYLMPMLIEMIKPRQASLNFQNKQVPTGLGLVFPLTVIPAIMGAMFLKILPIQMGVLNIITILGFGFLGIIDDTIGSREARGFNGHFRALFRGYLTTGAIKAIFGVVLALLVGFLKKNNVLNLILDLFVITLSANLLNLLDVRPGRAGKFFISWVLILFIGGQNPIIILFVLGSLIPYLFWDFRAEVMMGDVGSNILGAVIGLSATEFSAISKTLFMVVLILIHFYAERVSLSFLIERSPILKYIDNLGNKKI